ncbi:MAG: hypothetical protein IKA04_00865 [Alistipes sp.]|nr:hypothetical protein [Alistipes sp.]
MIEDIITHRCSFLIDRALRGLALDFDEALSILRNHNNFTTEHERHQHEILVAAIDNLIDFATSEEMTMISELPEEVDEECLLEYETICEQYNLTYAEAENEQVLFAAKMAAWWMAVNSESVITYMTQGDERVRPWHLSLEGVSYRKSEFPAELIPPIEWGCRCYLIANGFAAVRASLSIDKCRSMVDPVFRESLATGGRIFTDAHRYFDTQLPEFVKKIVKRLKSKFYEQDND